ncbi:MAG: TrbG/VirB9 family P-type conjugative transfer protein [Burkholderiaceae bacterium]|nr:TrbG/VirB9 family P-type conjugative transfer protein [Burkholderiaceae bacterium]
MPSLPCPFAAAWLFAFTCSGLVHAETSDPRLKEIWYDAHVVVTVPVKRGVVTHVLLDAGESITDVGSGLGADCSKPEASWCIAAQPGGRSIFVKPKSTASAPNNLAVVTDKRTHSFRFVVLADRDARPPVYRLSIKAPVARPVASAARAVDLVAPSLLASLAARPGDVAPPSPATLIAERLAAAPEVVNSNYSIAEGADSADIVPSLVFDDGRFTYFRFPNNREVPAVFNVLGDGTETVVNARMEGDLLAIDRVSRHLTLRAGSAVVGVWNEAFDLDGVPPTDGTTVAGVRRVMKTGLQPPSGAARPGSRP